MKKSILFILTTFVFLMNGSCDADIKRFAKQYNDERFEAYLEESDRKRSHTADSVRQLVAQYAQKELPCSFSSGITLSNIDTINVHDIGSVWCRMYFTTKTPLDSLTLATKVDSILTNSHPFNSWLKYGEYSRNVEF